MTEAQGPAAAPPLPSWMKEEPGFYPGAVRFLCQLSNDEMLFERPTEDGQSVNGYVIYDRRKWLIRHFEPDDAVREALRKTRAEAPILRAIEGEEGFLFSEGTTELRLIKDGRARSAYFYDGLDGDGRRRTIRIATFFLAADRVLLVDPDRGCMRSLDRAEVMKALNEAEAGGDWTPVDINELGIDQQHFPYGPPASENAMVLSSFREDAVYFAMASSARHIQYLRVHAFDLESETLRDYEWPLMPHTDLAFLRDLYERKRGAFYAYLDALSIVWHRYEDFLERVSGAGLLWLEDRVIFTNDKILEVKLDGAGAEPIPEGARPFAGRLRDVYSPSPEDQERGVVAHLQALGLWHSPAFEDYLARRYTMDELAAVFGPVIDAMEFEPDRLRRFASVFFRYPGRVELGKRWLDGGLARRWIAVGLLTGLVSRPATEKILGFQGDENAPRLGDIPEIYGSPQDIPLEAFRRVVEEAVAAAKAESARFGMMEKPPGSNPAFNLIHAILLASVSWQTDQGLAIVREMASMGVPEIDFQIADIIEDRRLSPLRDLVVGYVGHRDALVVEKAALALRVFAWNEAEDGLIALLGASDRLKNMTACKALAELGSEKSLAALAYADIVESFLDEKRYEGDIEIARNPRTRSYAKAAIDTGLTRLEMDLELDPSPWSADPRREEKRRMFADHTVLNCYRDACRNYADNPPPAGNRKFRTGSHLDTIRGLEDLAELRERLTEESLEGLFPRRKEKDRQVLEFLRWHLEAGGPEDTLYLAALIFHLTPKYLKLDKRGRVTRDIAISLKVIYERMSEETDFRGLFGVFAALELGLDRKWERRALEVFEKGDWRGWPRLMRVGIRVLRHRPEGERFSLYGMLLADIGGGPGYEEALFDIAKKSPHMAIRLYESGGFKFDPVVEGLLYGLADDLRGFQDILNAPRGAHTRQSIEFLEKHGGPEAVEVIGRALDRWHTAGDVVNRVLEGVAKCKKLSGSSRL